MKPFCTNSTSALIPLVGFFVIGVVSKPSSQNMTNILEVWETFQVSGREVEKS